MADQGFFQSFIECGGTIKEFEQVEAFTGEILSVTSQIDKIKKAIKEKTRGEYILWVSKIDYGPIELVNIWREIYGGPPDYYQIVSEIEDAEKEIKSTINMIDSGISQEDLEVIGTAIWLGELTNKIVTILSDDRDLLTSGHLICSYRGKKVHFVSTYELLMKMEWTDMAECYLDHFDIPSEQILSDNLNSTQLESNLNLLIKKARLGFHPSLRNRSVSILSLISR